MSISISMQQMLEAGVHFGHQKRFWNPKMAPYIYGEREKLHIVDLQKSLPLFRELLEKISHVTAKRGKVLIVGTKHAARDIVKEEAVRCGMPYVDNRWLGGMLTNYKTIRQSIKRLKDLEAMLENPKALQGKTKKEVLTIQREKDKLSMNLEGIKNMGGLPDMLFVIDVQQEKTAILEAKRLGIAVAAIVDTNGSPDEIDYIVPGNDDAMRAIRFYCKTVADVIIESRRTILEEEAAVQKEKAERSKAKTKTPEVKTTKKVTKKVNAEAVAEVVAEAAVAVPAKKPAAKKAKK
ncbi:MAG: 30S ribosomal protein S2 [Gammaproteobacteria bacterium RIFCSPHIGHO2_12_FULL_38_11]|nr:MAG: 30S ribosomal protein S2 [Gammaproteobacteria bacterium RIFCSPHIGHO2_12_FULL_38_11]